MRDESCCCFPQRCAWSRRNLVDSLELRLLHALHILLKPRQVQNLAGHQQPQYDLLDKSPGEAAAEVICFNICLRVRVQQWKLCYDPVMQHQLEFELERIFIKCFILCDRPRTAWQRLSGGLSWMLWCVWAWCSNIKLACQTQRSALLSSPWSCCALLSGRKEKYSKNVIVPN